MSSATTARRHARTCHLCEAMCGVVISLDANDQITSIRGDRDDPFSRGHICPKAVALQDLQEDPDRLRVPVRRTATGWEELSWPDALDAAAAGLRKVQDDHSDNSVAVYLGNPSVHSLGAMLFSASTIRALHTKNRFSATSVDQLPHHFAAWAMLGHQLLIPIPDLDRTDFLLIIGANPAASNGSLMTAPDVRRRLQDISARGGQVVLVDPRRTETAELATEHHFIRPGTDAFLLAALLQVIFAEGLEQLGPLAEHVEGLTTLKEAVSDLTPEAVSGHTGIPASSIRQLARAFAASDSAVCYARMGASTQAFGGACQWLSLALTTVTGNLDRPGGAMFTLPAADVVAGIGGQHRPGSFDRWRSRVSGLPEFGGELPVSILCEEMVTPGEGQVRGLLTHAGNPVLSTPDGPALDEALSGLDFMVSIDLYINETTRHADIILPPVGPLERDHYDLIFNALAIRNVARYSEPMLTPPEGALQDWEILLGLEERLSRRTDIRTHGERTVRRKLGPAGILDLALRTGPYGSGWKLWREGMSLKMLRAHPHGIDLGPLEPCLPQRLFTPDKRIQLAPEPMLADLPRLKAVLSTDLTDGLLLIGRRQLRSNNSWMHNSERLVRGRDRCTLLIHPDDASGLGVVDGAPVRVRSRIGEVEIVAEVSDEIMPGVVSIPHGWGHSRAGTRLSVASARPGVSMNDLTDPTRLDEMTGNAVLNGVPVEVSALGIG
ncbi:MAG: anaerobic selenocysteine-containing dehydrogenase [Myxococcota bacterium]|jgi:anaerobic selenocysteine-containing dehydrogenase